MLSSENVLLLVVRLLGRIGAEAPSALPGAVATSIENLFTLVADQAPTRASNGVSEVEGVSVGLSD